ncbi:MAG: VanZ family protein [Bacilli bacterium]|nr:VanZ family protein [Bacilli bacterium]
MRTIIGYIINMLPYMILAIPIYLIVRGIIIKKHNKKINLYHELTLFIFVLFIVGLFSQTIIPKFEFGVNGFGIVKNGVHKTNLIPFRVLFETYREVFINGYIEYFLINFLGNIILFIPFGFVIPLLWNVSNRKVIVIGACISFFIEISQLLLARGTDVDDLILNTSGVILGLLLYKLLYKKNYKIMDKFKI